LSLIIILLQRIVVCPLLLPGHCPGLCYFSLSGKINPGPIVLKTLDPENPQGIVFLIPEDYGAAWKVENAP
jgi:hypothetical protein